MHQHVTEPSNHIKDLRFSIGFYPPTWCIVIIIAIISVQSVTSPPNMLPPSGTVHLTVYRLLADNALVFTASLSIPTFRLFCGDVC